MGIFKSFLQNLKPILSDLPLIFNKNYSLSHYNNPAYLIKKQTNNQFFSRSTAYTSTFMTQIQTSKIEVFQSVLNFNAFGVKEELIMSTCSASLNKESFISLYSYQLSLLCMTIVCVPSNKFDIINNYEVTQCSLSCISNPRTAITFYAYKNHKYLTEQFSYKKEFVGSLQTYFTADMVVESIDTMCKPNYGLPKNVIVELEHFKKTIVKSYR